MKPAWRSLIILCLVAWCVLPGVASAQEHSIAQEHSGEPGDEPEPVLTEVGARFFLGSTTFRRSIDDFMSGVVAHAEPGYSLGAYATVWRRGWLRVQAELLYSARHTTLAETSGDFLMSGYSLKYLELPVLARLDVPLFSRVQPFIAFGVAPGVLVDAKHSLVGDVPDGVLHRWELGLVGAAGARVPLSRSWDLTFELRGIHGISDTFVRTSRQSSAVVVALGIGYTPPRRPGRAPAGDAVALAGYPAGMAMAPAVMLRCDAPESSQLVPGDVIDHVILAGRLRTLHVHMTSGRVYCYRLRPGVQVPGGTYQGSKSGRALTITSSAGTETTLELSHATAVQEAWNRIQAPASFRVVVSANQVAAEDLAQKLADKGVSRQTAERVAGKVAGDRRLKVEEAGSVAEALEPGQNAGDDASWFVPFDETSWQVWMQRYGGKEDAFGPGQGDLSARAVGKILASHKQALGIEDPPVVTAQQLQQRVEQDPALRESWNGLPRWQRDFLKEYWKRYPRTNMGGDTDLALTEDVRFRMALHMSIAYMPEGVREAARVLFSDPVFIAACTVSITLYVAAIFSPEPLFTKATAFAITASLLTVFSLSEIYHLASAWFRLREHAADARTLDDLDAGAREFGKATGGTSLRVLVALATMFAGRALPAPRPGPTAPPTAPAVVAVSPAGTAAVARTLVAGEIRIVVLTDGTIVLPVAGSVAASSMVGGGTGGSTSSSTGSAGTTGSGASKPESATSTRAGPGSAAGRGNQRATQAKPDNPATANQKAPAAESGASTAAMSPSAARRALARSLEAAGHVRPPGAAAHHIVAFKARDAALARKVLARFGIGINDAANGVFLPATRKAPNPTGTAVHSELHTNQYYERVNDLLRRATTRAEAEAILASIRKKLLSGGL